MPITELLDRIPFSPPRQRGPEADPPEPPRTFEVELPTVDRVEPEGLEAPRPDPYALAEGDSLAPEAPATDAPEAPATDAPEAPATDAPEAPARPAPAGWTVRALPSWAAAVIGGLALLCLALAVTLAAVLFEADPVQALPASDEGLEAPAAQPPAEAPAEAALEPATAPSSFAAEPSPIPVELITRLEEASDQPLEVELTRLLDAVQHGFGRRSARLEPTLRSYVYRMASRFEWNPATFRVAVTAPDPDLAAARGALLEQLFSDAVEAGRLDVGTGVGPHGLTLVAPQADASTNPE